MSERPFITGQQGGELLTRLLDGTGLSDVEQEAFQDMSGQHGLSSRQLLWIQRVALRLQLIDEPVRNDWSSRTPAEQQRIRGRDVPTPPVLLNRPLKPPGR